MPTAESRNWFEPMGMAANAESSVCLNTGLVRMWAQAVKVTKNNSPKSRYGRAIAGFQPRRTAQPWELDTRFADFLTSDFYADAEKPRSDCVYIRL
jgi:hypothetical protein